MSAETLRLLLIDDDALLRDRVLTPRLRQFGFEVMAIGHVGEMAQAIERRKPDIVLLDIGLPDHDGFEVSRTLRARFSDIGIVMLTGRSETTDRVRGLSEGADAYLSKPVEIDVLVATLHSVARRLKSPSNSVVPAGTWKLDSGDWLLLSPSGGRVILSKTERLLLEELMKQPNQVVARDTLIAAITDDIHAFDPHRLDSLIHRLRRKVLASTGEPLLLNAVHGQGYLLAVS
ncbi:response regulator transcription factor [Rhodanobacter sp. C03]|uniref:response regulator transcription factor n=1 Tax=Rhodanobacter sp. C03 TaxID=1945858 RepID=UPI0009878EF2|nr:response regulator transcription factor [Rhodanobacter sp. C03]OOG56351.1 DNA-binding response regulator [Rhodanobacter sp. C03]